jgi:prolipoprotein diacylglyceryltransferase
MHIMNDIAFRIGGIPVHRHGILIAIGVLFAIGIILIKARRKYHPYYEFVYNISPTNGYHNVTIPYSLQHRSLHP